MADPVEMMNSDEDQYADDDFEEYESDEVTTFGSRYGSDEANTDSDSVNSPKKLKKKYKSVFNAPLIRSANKYQSQYESSSEDEQEVVIGQTVAEINTIAMDLNDASDFDEKSMTTLMGNDGNLLTERKVTKDDDAVGEDDVYNYQNETTFIGKIDWDNEAQENTSDDEDNDRDNQEKSDIDDDDDDEEEPQETNRDVEQTTRLYRPPTTRAVTSSDSENQSESNSDVEVGGVDDEDYQNQEVDRMDSDYRKLHFMEADSQSEMTLDMNDVRSGINSELSDVEDDEGNNEYEGDYNEYDERHESLKLNKTDHFEEEDRYEEDFEECDVDDVDDDGNEANQNDEKVYYEEDYRQSAGRDGEITYQIEEETSPMDEVAIEMEKMNIKKVVSSESLTDSTDNSKITSILTAAFQNQGQTGADNIDGMIQVLSMIKQNLANIPDMQTQLSSTSKSTNNLNQAGTTSSNTSLKKTSSLQEQYQKSRTASSASCGDSQSKIPRFIAALKKSCSSLNSRKSQQEEEAVEDVEEVEVEEKNVIKKSSCYRMKKREEASDYDSCSSNSVKSNRVEASKKISSTTLRVGNVQNSKLIRPKIDAVSDYDSCSTSSSKLNCRIQSGTPTSFNSDQHVMHMNLIKKPSKPQVQGAPKAKGSNRKNFSFSNTRLREIERHNLILLRKIESQKPAYTPQKLAKDKPSPAAAARISSAAINRKKQQRQIDLDNQLLKRKLEAIHYRRTKK